MPGTGNRDPVLGSKIISREVVFSFRREMHLCLSVRCSLWGASGLSARWGEALAHLLSVNIFLLPSLMSLTRSYFCTARLLRAQLASPKHAIIGGTSHSGPYFQPEHCYESSSILSCWHTPVCHDESFRYVGCFIFSALCFRVKLVSGDRITCLITTMCSMHEPVWKAFQTPLCITAWKL